MAEPAVKSDPFTPPETERFPPVVVNLRNPNLAALLAWLWPGLGHIYQRRYAKGILFMACILGTWFSGLCMGGGHAVYASFTKEDRRLQFICQAGVGLPAFPAVVQAYMVFKGLPPGADPPLGGFMAPPKQPVQEMSPDQLADWHLKWPLLFEMGTLYTVLAGLLNVLAIYDAYAGPVYPEEKKKDDDEKKKNPAQ